jgi:hypothetical protein
MIRCYKCGGKLTYVQRPGFHSLDCKKCGPDQMAIWIVVKKRTRKELGDERGISENQKVGEKPKHTF